MGIVRAGRARRNEAGDAAWRGRDALPEVRRAGRRLELVVGGVPYSTFHPDRPWTGWVWDALAAAALLRDPAPRHVLMLGCGAGTVLALLRRLLPDAALTAVELDPRVLELARKRFGLDRLGAELVEGDGLAYLAKTRRRFDLVLDDMFGHDGNGLLRPVVDEVAHLRLVASRLAAGGIAATNATTDDDPPGLERAVRAAYRAVFRHRVSLTPPRGWNVVLAGSDRPIDRTESRRRASALPAADAGPLQAVKVRAQ